MAPSTHGGCRSGYAESRRSSSVSGMSMRESWARNSQMSTMHSTFRHQSMLTSARGQRSHTAALASDPKTTGMLTLPASQMR